MDWSVVKDVVEWSTELASKHNVWRDLFQWYFPGKSEDSTVWQEELWKLQTTLPLMQLMIDRAEWSFHKEGVPKLLQELKGVSYDTEDLLEELEYVKFKSEIKDGTKSLDFSKSDLLSRLNEVKILQKRADFLMGQMNSIVPQNGTPHFDRSVRPETGSVPESKMFGRHEEMKAVKRLLGVPEVVHSGQKRNRRQTLSSVTAEQKYCLDDSENKIVPVMAIVGIGGVGKTTLAQQVFHDPHVKAHFDKEFWICVSDEFDTKRLTTELLSSSVDRMPSDNLNHLQTKLAEVVKSKRFLLVLDDIWDDALKGNGQEWQRFCAPLMSGLQGSMILVTTRSSHVAKSVCTIDLFQLDGLQDAAFWEFFKACALDSKGCTDNSNLESIGRKIVLKLKGSPLAAKTIGRLLSMKLDTRHWNNVLRSELWELKQEKGDILPALRLSYVYLPQQLKRCLSLCAVFPKDHKFEQKVLVDIWLAQGFVASQGEISMSTVGDWYFKELRDRCFFQKIPVSPGAVAPRVQKYVMHDLIHDMVQLVSENECFIIRNETDLLHVPESVRHLSLFTNKSIDFKNLMALSRCKKIRSILSTEQVGKTAWFPLLDHWSNQLKYLRFLSCCFTTLKVLPESVGNFSLLRCLKIHIPRSCDFNTFPDSFCSLHNLQTFEAPNCHFQKIPTEFRYLINLQFFREKIFQYERHYTLILESHKGVYKDISLLKNFSLQGKLHLRLGGARVADAVQIELSKRNLIECLILEFDSSDGAKDQELLEALCPHRNIEYLDLRNSSCLIMPTWFEPQCLQQVRQLLFSHLRVLTIAWADIGTNQMGFSSLMVLHISRCPSLSSLDQILQPGSLPTIRTILIEDCGTLSSIPAKTFGNFSCLEQLKVLRCQQIKWIGLVLPRSLSKLCLEDCGDISDFIPNCLLNLNELIHLSLTNLRIRSIPAQLWAEKLPKLELLEISRCPELTSLGGPEGFTHIENVFVDSCPQLKDMRQPLRRGRRRS